MRLSGTYFERLLINVIPWTIFASGLIFIINDEVGSTIATFVLSTCAFWLMDTVIIIFKFKNPKTLRSNITLLWGGKSIASNEISEIRPILDKRFRWSFRMVQFFLKDGSQFIVIDKPQTVIADFMNRPSKTVTLLVERHPELGSKVKSLKAI